jgi:dynein assembly factor with WDR repeat domains 1
MRLKRFLLRYFPPGLILEYERRDGSHNTTCIDLLQLSHGTDLSLLADQLVAEQPLISETRKPQLIRLLQKLLDKQGENDGKEYGLFKVLRAHILPLTNCAFNKGGDRFITGSYDRTCKVWESSTGKELATLEGHKNVVYAISFNNPFG